VTWEPEIEELKQRRELAARLGGEERVARHVAAGKLTVRQRIDALVDDGSFREIGSLTGFATYDDDGSMRDFTPANFICGRATVDERPIVVGGDDFTVRGGSAEAALYNKLAYSERYARSLRLPVVRLVDGSGGGGSVATYLAWGRTYVPPLPGMRDQIEILSEVPVVAAALGSVAGLGAARVTSSHFSVMVEGISSLFIAGPPVVAYATHEDVGKEELGGTDVHTTNGSVDNPASDEKDAFAQIARFLSYLPSSVWDLPPIVPSQDPVDRRDEELLSIVPRERRRGYDVRRLIGHVVDAGSLFEIGPRWGRSVVTGFARLAGHPVGVIAMDPAAWGGALTADGSEKMRRHADLCNTFHVPIVAFVDQPGFAVGTVAERAATIRRGVNLIAALYQVTVPFFSLVVRRAFGVAGAALVDRGNPNHRAAWPSGDWGSLPLEGGVEAAYRRDLEAAEDPAALREELLERFEAVRSPFRTAEAFDIEEIIDPRDTRPTLCEWVQLVYRTLTVGRTATGFRP
jgi:acetyl-CoA carboxylase carboxyltransferase component